MRKKLLHNKYLNALTIIILVFALVGCTSVAEISKVEEHSISYEDLQSKIEIENAMKHIKNLVEFSPRLAGLSGEIEAGKYLFEAFNNLNLVTEIETFPIMIFEEKGLEVDLKNQEESIPLAANIIYYSTSTIDGGLKDLPLIYAGMGKTSELVDLDLTGSIAVVDRGEIYLRDKVINCASKGAEAIIIINNEDAPLISSLLEESTVPAIALSSSDGKRIFDALVDGKLRGNLFVETDIMDTTSNNIIGLKKSSNDTDQVLIIGAHYDSVNTPGANDNAAGVGGLLEIATVLKDVDLPFNIQYIAFGSEEVGLMGSTSHVQSKYANDNSHVIGMINLDGIGMGNTLMVARENKDSSKYLVEIMLKAASDLNIKAVEFFHGFSDHTPFENVGVPVAFLAFGPGDPKYYHSELDTFDTLEPQSVENTVKVVLKTIVALVSED